MQVRASVVALELTGNWAF